MALSVNAQSSFVTIKTFGVPEAHQGVAVGKNFFYAIDTRRIAKYDKQTGEKVAEWREKVDRSIKHLDSGVVVGHKLYAAQSNYPKIPMTSSVEIWDTKTLEHVQSYSFGIRWGSFTWVDRYNGFWWGVFAHYQKFKKETGKDNSWTTLIKFDDSWNPLQSWVFPQKVLKRFRPMSNSGGSWGADDMLYISGHNRPIIYKMGLPKAGSELVLKQEIPIASRGQGIAWDRTNKNVLYSMDRDKKQVIISKLKKIKK